jgi:hypothetical protein
LSATCGREPARFDVLEFPPGEEAEFDFGLGAPTLHKGDRWSVCLPGEELQG